MTAERKAPEPGSGGVIVIAGNPVDGMTFHGPFLDWDAAVDWGTDNGDGDWWVAPLHRDKVLTDSEREQQAWAQGYSK